MKKERKQGWQLQTNEAQQIKNDCTTYDIQQTEYYFEIWLMGMLRFAELS